MRKILSFLFIFFIPFMLSAKPKVLATASMWYDMAKVIGGEMIEVDFIVPIGSDPHLYEPTPNDVRKVNSADLILINGLTFEGWLQKLIRSSGTKARSLLITEGITPISNPAYNNSTDPHAWMDAIHGITYAENITKALQALDPIHSKEYAFNFGIYKQQLEELHQYISTKMAAIPAKQKILITSHDAFHYFGNRYGLQVESLIGTSTEADVQTGAFIRINKLIKENKIPAVFIESTINPKLMEQISKENNIVIGGKLYADSIGDENSPASGYLQMLKHNANVIADALMKTTAENFDANAPSNKLKSILFYIPFLLLLITLIVILVKKSR